MRNIWWIMKRELESYFKTPVGYLVITAFLIVTGLLFHAFAIGDQARRSEEVLEHFFFLASGTVLVSSVFVSMRLLAEERQSGTLVLLFTSPIKDYQLILGKFLSALSFMTIALAFTAYMPAMIMVNGKISLGHITTGYLGLLLIGGAAISLCLLCSALSPNQLVAAMLGAAVVTTFVLLWLLSRIASPPIEELLAYLSIHDKHFRPFMRGILSLRDVVFYLSLIYLSLLCATRVVESRRWH